METELRNLKSESAIQPGIFDRVKGLLGQSNDKGKMAMRAQEEDIEAVGLMDKETKKVKNVINETKTVIQTAIKDTTQRPLLSQHNYYAFGVFFVIGCLFLFLALTFLPLILIAPNKFNTFFSLGQFFINLALAFYQGPAAYIKLLFSKENLMISVFYMLSLMFAIYSSLIWGNYLSSLLVVALQVFSLGWLIQQTFKGGEQATEDFKGFLKGKAAGAATQAAMFLMRNK